MTALSNCPSCGADLPAASAFCPDCGKPVGAPDSDAALHTIGGFETLGGDTTRDRRSADDAVPELQPGARFADRFVIVEKIGAGGMGVVYRATDDVTKQEVALKLIRPDRLRGEGDVQRLVQEGLVSRNVRHKNVVAVYDVGEANGQPFLTMEVLEGRSLRAWHRSMKERGEDVPYAVAARIVREVLAGLEAAHEQGVVHRDLKPENIMLLAEPTATSAPLKIVDFGIARAAGAAQDSGTGTGAGTPRYMAPEQITQADLAGPTADLYSLSVVFYELLVDVLPQGHWQPPSGGRSDVPRAIDDLVQAGLSNRPGSRPTDVATYLSRMDAAEKGWSGADFAQKLSDPFDLKKKLEADPARKRKWQIAFAVIIVLALLAALSEEGVDGQQEWDHDDDRRRVETVELEDLTGMWIDTFGTAFEVYVEPDGELSGGATMFDGTVIDFEGSIKGRDVRFELSTFGMPTLVRGRGTWDGAYTVSYRATDANGMTTDGRFAIQSMNGDF